MSIELKVPPAGESISEVVIATWLKKEGQNIQKDEALVEIETDKATLEIPSPVTGVIGKILKSQGESAHIGEVIAHIEEGALAQDNPPKADSPSTGSDQSPQLSAQTFVMPAAQKLANDKGIDTSTLQGTGPGGRVLKEDVQKAASPGQAPLTGSGQAPTTPSIARQASTFRQEDVVPMTPLRKKIAERLVQAQHTAALLTTFNEVDMTNVMALRSEYKDMFEKKHGVRLGFMSFFVKAAIEALKAIPQLNAEIRGSDIVYKNYYDIGVAVSTPKGLVVPVLRNTERMSFAEIEKSIGEFGKRAQDNKILPDELQGGTFTISNGGVFGSLMSTPIVNPPQSGVLGMHAIQERPIAKNGQVVIAPMMYIALTYDHRIVDGREGVTFLKKIKEAVENPARILLEI